MVSAINLSAWYHRPPFLQQSLIVRSIVRDMVVPTTKQLLSYYTLIIQ
jgi:hypothetical protein